MQILTRTGAFREGHFVYPNGKHSPHYFQMPLAFRYYDTARVLAVALSRKYRLEKDISSQLPKDSVISPSSGGIGEITWCEDYRLRRDRSIRIRAERDRGRADQIVNRLRRPALRE